MRIGTFDIETSPHEAHVWGMWQQNVATSQLIQPTAMMTFAWKWYGEKKIIYRTWSDEDFHITLHALLNEADMVVGYNHDKFDLRHVNREFAERGFRPCRPVATVDCLKVVKQNFNFPHNRLDYVAQRLLGESKLSTGGFELWPAFMRGEAEALKTMKKYNIQDTVLTEKLYTFLRPWVRNHPYVGNVPELDDSCEMYRCPACDSMQIERLRPRRTRCFAIRVVNCRNCGAFFDGRRKKM